MRKEERTIYITDDDEEFTDWVSARDHERVRAVRKVLDSSDICWRDTCSVEAAAVIVNSYLLLTPAVASAGANLLERVDSFLAGFADDPDNADVVVPLMEELDTLRSRLDGTHS
jgi:hypothetical protein